MLYWLVLIILGAAILSWPVQRDDKLLVACLIAWFIWAIGFPVASYLYEPTIFVGDTSNDLPGTFEP